MSATAGLSAGTIATFADPSGDNHVALTAALAIVTGVVAPIAGVLRLGFPAGFISEPILKGFVVGLALTIIMGQLPKLFGVDDASGNFFERLWGHWHDSARFEGPVREPGIVVLRVEAGLFFANADPSASGWSPSRRPRTSTASSSTARACRSST